MQELEAGLRDGTIVLDGRAAQQPSETKPGEAGSETPDAIAGGPPAHPAAQAGLRIVVVEDNRNAADSLQRLLTQLGHDVRVAYTGPEGAEAVTGWRPDIVLSGIGLPGLDGYAVAREVRRNPSTANTRLIAITRYGREEDRRHPPEAGLDHIL